MATSPTTDHPLPSPFRCHLLPFAFVGVGRREEGVSYVMVESKLRYHAKRAKSIDKWFLQSIVFNINIKMVIFVR